MRQCKADVSADVYQEVSRAHALRCSAADTVRRTAAAACAAAVAGERTRWRDPATCASAFPARPGPSPACATMLSAALKGGAAAAAPAPPPPAAADDAPQDYAINPRRRGNDVEVPFLIGSVGVGSLRTPRARRVAPGSRGSGRAHAAPEVRVDRGGLRAARPHAGGVARLGAWYGYDAPPRHALARRSAAARRWHPRVTPAAGGALHRCAAALRQPRGPPPPHPGAAAAGVSS